MSRPSSWYKVLAPCPKCQRLPALRLEGWLIHAARTAEPDQPILDFQCQHRRCKAQYVIAAHAITRAELVNRFAA